MMKNEVIIKDNLLDDIHLIQLGELIDLSGPLYDKFHSSNSFFPWYLQKEQVMGKDDGCWLSHILYDEDVPKSDLYIPIIKIFKGYLKYVTLCRLNVNLLLRKETPSVSDFHTDCDWDFKDEEKLTTAIFYLNTNNGATEFEDGDKIDSVRNRLVMFPI